MGTGETDRATIRGGRAAAYCASVCMLACQACPASVCGRGLPAYRRVLGAHLAVRARTRSFQAVHFKLRHYRAACALAGASGAFPQTILQRAAGRRAHAERRPRRGADPPRRFVR